MDVVCASCKNLWVSNRVRTAGAIQLTKARYFAHSNDWMDGVTCAIMPARANISPKVWTRVDVPSGSSPRYKPWLTVKRTEPVGSTAPLNAAMAPSTFSHPNVWANCSFLSTPFWIDKTLPTSRCLTLCQADTISYVLTVTMSASASCTCDGSVTTQTGTVTSTNPVIVAPCSCKYA